MATCPLGQAFIALAHEAMNFAAADSLCFDCCSTGAWGLTMFCASCVSAETPCHKFGLHAGNVGYTMHELLY